jgi:hypothetical protein
VNIILTCSPLKFTLLISTVCAIYFIFYLRDLDGVLVGNGVCLGVLVIVGVLVLVGVTVVVGNGVLLPV